MSVMAKKSRQQQRAVAARRARAVAQQRTFPVMPVLVGGIVVLGIVAILAVVLSGNDTSGDGGVAQTRPVTVEGTALATMPDTAGATDPAIGAKAPTLIGEDFSGKKVTIGDDGKAKAIMFVAHWCPHCQREVPIVSAYVKSPGLPSGMELFVVPTSTNADAPNYPPSKWLESAGMGDVPTLVDDKDGKAHAAYGGGGFPFLVLVKQDGTVAARFSGELGESAYPRLFTALAKGEPIPGANSGATSETPTS
jgi:thiol-disulfide isomerase/thioredoxin